MKRQCLGAMCGLAGALSVHGQVIVDNSVQARLRLVEVMGTTAVFTRAATANAGTPVTLDRTRRFEVEYCLTPGDGTSVPAGLSFGVLQITGNTGTYAKALLSKLMAQTGGTTPVLLGEADSSGAPTGVLAGATGMHRPYRGGFSPNAGNNAAPSNGTIGPGGISNILPLTLSQVLGPTTESDWYALYSFTVTVPDAFMGLFSVAVDFVPDAQSGARFSFFNDGNPAPRTSTNATGAMVAFEVSVPAQGSAGMLAAFGVLGARRRRQP